MRRRRRRCATTPYTQQYIQTNTGPVDKYSKRKEFILSKNALFVFVRATQSTLTCKHTNQKSKQQQQRQQQMCRKCIELPCKNVSKYCSMMTHSGWKQIFPLLNCAPKNYEFVDDIFIYSKCVTVLVSRSHCRVQILWWKQRFTL